MKLIKFMHEIIDGNRHRIVAVDEHDEVHVSDWFHTNDLAVLGDYYANANSESPLPIGVFTVKEMPWKSV